MFTDDARGTNRTVPSRSVPTVNLPAHVSQSQKNSTRENCSEGMANNRPRRKYMNSARHAGFRHCETISALALLRVSSFSVSAPSLPTLVRMQCDKDCLVRYTGMPTLTCSALIGCGCAKMVSTGLADFSYHVFALHCGRKASHVRISED